MPALSRCAARSNHAATAQSPCARLSRRLAAPRAPPPLSRRAGFTPQLAAAYEMANEDEKRFEVVFVSSDESAQARAWILHGACTEAPEAPRDPMAVLVALQAQAGYMEEMHGDWLRVPFDSPLRDALKQQ